MFNAALVQVWIIDQNVFLPEPLNHNLHADWIQSLAEFTTFNYKLEFVFNENER